jgi:hypothetical protein
MKNQNIKRITKARSLPAVNLAGIESTKKISLARSLRVARATEKTEKNSSLKISENRSSQCKGIGRERGTGNGAGKATEKD